MRLLIISHTEHYLRDDVPVGWGPTVREVDHLTSFFDEIVHVAPLHPGPPPEEAIPYQSDTVRLSPIKPSGGERLRDKWSVLSTAGSVLAVVRKEMKETDWFQFRAPTGMGVYLIPWLCLRSRTSGWFKYAGNWNQTSPPMGYRIQRAFLWGCTSRKTTINGKWANQRPHLLSFENPCLTEDELEVGRQILEKKDYSGKIDFCFVGRLEDAKGVRRILNSFADLDHPRIGSITFIGDGPDRREYQEMARNLRYSVTFHGFLPREMIGPILGQKHILLLPTTASEGFPKVIAEAANYGCIPVVSDVSSIPQYVRDGVEGFVCKAGNDQSLRCCLDAVLTAKPDELITRAKAGRVLARKFTYGAYISRIRTEVLGL